MSGLPPGYTLIPPDAEVDPIRPPASTGLIPSNALPDVPGQYQPWKGSILPVSGSGAPGDWHGDWNAGLIGKALDAFTLPGDVVAGRQPVYGPGTGAIDPSLAERSLNFAGFASPQPASSRLSVAPYRTMSTETRVGEGGPLSGPLLSSRVGPTGPQLQTAAKAGYKEAEVSPVTAPSSSVAAFGAAAQQRLYDEHRLVPGTAPKTFEVLDNLANPTGPTSYIDLAAARSQLGAIAKKTDTPDRDPFAATQAIDHLDKLIDPMYPAAATARGNQAAAFRASELTGDLTRANTGILEKADTAAQLRARVKTLTQSEDRMRGFSDAEKQALEDFADGKGILNTALNKTGNLVGGIVGKAAATVAGGFAGSTFGPAGGIAGTLGGLEIGPALKSWEAARASAQLKDIGDQLRSRSPLGEQMLAQNVRAPSPLNRAILPLVTPPPMTPQPQPGQFPPMQPVNPNAPGPPRPTGEYFQPYGGPDPGPQRFPFGTPLPRGLLSGWS
jgi:hypothetical protein